ncbi:DUF2147 domain-containing protein [Roseovarius sp.]|mgnify:CR=1 FL=1|jgi:uncharacterized protein (DUF2147 family)|uniref:DUF2147 domain-containing protein n=1 Tax=Roseovarius sp. TaxID=1486281 RepID=UPI0026130E68|nr:DUF2147 domain-containing protein [Roseovarius sp.]MDM8168729.1 DUF2147 domain-containing protein [Roseovarius sp.]
MKRLAMTIAALGLSAGAAFADPVEGTWKTEPGDSGGYLHVSVYGCGEAICGAIRKAFDAQGQSNDSYEHLNKRMLWDMQAEGGGQYGNGKIWAPDRGKTYNSKMSLNGNTLTVEGCVAVFCRGQTWTRVQ